MAETGGRVGIDDRRGDWSRFFGAWIRNPLTMGAIAPSSPRYGAMMVRHASTGIDGPILELGPGLGVVTRTLIEAGIAPERITSIEYDPDFAQTLKARFPRVDVVHGDGFDLDHTLGERRDERFAAILFAIPILHLSQARRQALFSDYIRRLKPGGNLTQLSYLLTAPVKPVPGLFDVGASTLVWSNIPPARVWIYSAATSGRAGPAGTAST